MGMTLLSYRSLVVWIYGPAANNQLSTVLFRGTFANRVPGVSLFTQDFNCHCFDPNTSFVLNPAAWTNPAAGQFGTSAAYYGDYAYQRRPIENLNLGRTVRIGERVSFNVRAEFSSVFQSHGEWRCRFYELPCDSDHPRREDCSRFRLNHHGVNDYL